MEKEFIKISMRCQRFTTVGIALLVMGSMGSNAADQVKSAVKQEQTQTITILHTNDIHGHLEAWQGWEGELKNHTVGGLDRLSARIHEARGSAAPNSVLLYWPPPAHGYLR